MRAPRIIIESRRWSAAEAQAEALQAAGMDPIVCTGPTDHGGACPLLVGETCPVVADADAVVYDLDLDRDDDRAVLRSLVHDHAGLPVITERSHAESHRHADDLQHCSVVLPYSPGHTAEAVLAALGGRPEDDAT